MTFSAHRAALAVAAVVLALLAGPPAAQASGSQVRTSAAAGAADVVGPGGVVPLVPARLLDTRTGAGTTAAGAVPAMGTVSLRVAGRSGLPASGVAAVVLNVTSVAPTTGGYLTVYPDGHPRPTASSLNYRPGQAVPNEVVVKVGDNGNVALFNGSPGTTHLLVDVAGYVVGGQVGTAGGTSPLTPARLLDTRSTTAVPALGTTHLQVTGRAGVPADGVAAVLVNLTAVTPRTGGFLTAHPSGAARPTASNLNYAVGQTTATSAVVQVGAGGRIALFNGAPAATHLLVDVAGYVLAGTPTAPGALVGVASTRLLDTRTATAVPPMATRTVQVAGRGGVPAEEAAAVVLTVTAVAPSSAGYLTAYPGGASRPTTSNLNYVSGGTTPNLVVVKLGRDGSVDLFNGSPTSTHLLVDVAGYVLPGHGVGSWTPDTVPFADHTGRPVGLGEVACVDVDACVALTSYGQEIVTVVDGEWYAEETPSFDDRRFDEPGALRTIDCTTDGVCVGVGSYLPGDASGYGPGLIVLGDGETWGSERPAVPADSDVFDWATTTDVDCSDDGSCSVIGTYNSPSVFLAGFVSVLRDGHWTSTKIAPDGARYVYLERISCGTPDSCVVVGGYDRNAGDRGLLVAELRDGAWSTTTWPLPTMVGGWETRPSSSLACSEDGSCVVGANYPVAGGQTASLLLNRTEAGWETTPASSYWNDAACTNDGDCYVTGWRLGTQDRSPDLYHHGGTGWTTETVPAAPLGGAVRELDRIACGSTECAVLGDQYTRGGATISSTTGDGWTTVSPQPHHLLSAVTCLPYDRCVVVGAYTDALGYVAGPLLLR